MEVNRTRVALVSFACFALLTPSFVFGYSRDTHKGISAATLQIYEQLNGDIFTDSEARRIIDGSFNEDVETRPLNHFLDPVKNRGLNVLGVTFPSSKVWASDTLGQGEYCNYLVCSSRIDYTDKLFTSPTDFSWDRAVYEYVYGDKERSVQTLGHILHLLQDATVPAHVRNDQHLNHEGFGDPDPYEEYTARFVEGKVELPGGVTTPRFHDLSSALEITANFTNQNFLSKDTIFKDSNPPHLSNLIIKDNFGYNPAIGHRVYFRKSITDQAGLKIFVSLLDDENKLVMKDYWTLLSREAINNGVGVIDLFFREVEKEKQSKSLLAKNVSQFEKHKEIVKQQIESIKTILGAKVVQPTTPPTSIVLGAETQNPDVVLVKEAPQVPESTLPLEIVEAADIVPVVELEVQEQPEEEERVGELPIPDTGPGIQELFPVPPGGGGGGPPPPQEEQEEEAVDTTAPSAPVVTSPSAGSFHATTTLSVSGTAEANSQVLLSYMLSAATITATTTALGDGTWSIGSLLFDEAENALSVSATDTSGNTSATTTQTFHTDVTTPVVSSFAVRQCTTPLVSGSCITTGRIDTTLTATSTDAAYYSLIVGGSIVSTSTSPDITHTLSAGSHSVSLAVYDRAGNGATSTSQTVEVVTLPIVINEVSWSGTTASANHQWIELYNRSAHTITLSSVYISTIDASFALPLSGTIAPGAYYLVERESGSTNVTTDALVAFPALSGTPPTQLALVYAPLGVATTTLDQTPDSSSCSGTWCGGSAGGAPKSMERKQASVSGTTTSNWTSNNTYTKNGLDSGSNAIQGTPRSQNSESLIPIGYYCAPSTESFVEGGYYQPSNGTCTYLSSGMSGNRYGDVYAGAVASSTIINGHSLGSSISSTQANDDIPSPYQGMDVFAVVYRVYSGQTITDFRAYFQSGSSSPPHLEYGVLRFKWGVAP